MNSLIKHIVYFDDYGNGYLDITHARFCELAAGRPFVMTLRHSDVEKLSQIVAYYHDVGDRRLSGDLLLTVSATGHLQIAAKLDNAESLYGLRPHMTVQFVFRN